MKEVGHMPAPSKIIRSVEEFVKEMSILRDKWFPDDALVPWCRGQERAEWSLLPKLYRLNPDNDALDIEHEIREEFATRSPALSEASCGPRQPGSKTSASWAQT